MAIQPTDLLSLQQQRPHEVTETPICWATSPCSRPFNNNDRTRSLKPKVAREFDFSTDNASFKRSQQAAALREQAEAYRTRAGQWGQGPDDVGAGAYGIEVYA